MVAGENYWGSVVGGLFDALLECCLGCGSPTSKPACPECGAPSQLAATLPTGAVGRWVEARRGLRRRQGLVLEVVGEELEILQLDGDTDRVWRRRVRVLGEPAGISRVRSAAGELLAAAQADTLPEPMRHLLHTLAVRQATTTLGSSRALAADGVALRDLSVLDELPLTRSERGWWRALGLWAGGDAGGSVEAMLELPDGRYPPRLLLWWRAARIPGVVRGATRVRVEAAAHRLARLSPVCAVAATLLHRALAHDDRDHHDSGAARGPGRGRRALRRRADGGRAEVEAAWSDARLVATTAKAIVEAPSDSGWHKVVDRWMRGEEGDIVAARLLGGLNIGQERLGPDPSVLDAAATEVLDDLIDTSSVPEDWIDRASELRCGDYLLARTRIAALDDDTLERMELHDERARRQVLAGKGVPAAGVTAETRRRLTRVAAARAGDDESLLSVAAENGTDLAELRRVLEAPGTMPAADLLADQSLAAVLARRSQLDPSGLSLEGLDSSQRTFASQVLLRRAKSSLHAWEWESALGLARECLRVARSELHRDEALNLIAAAHWQLGNDNAAIRALASALDGQYTAALSANMAVVAAELEPRTAAAHLSRLVVEAPNLTLRVRAARQAVLIWGHSDEPWTEGASLPPDLAVALRALVVEPLAEDDFREIARILAEHDSEWLARPGSLDRSPHRDTVAARVWVARAKGLEAFVPELAEALDDGAATWAEPLRDQLVAAAVDALAVDEPSVGATSFGVMLLTEGLPMAIDARVVLQAFAARGAALGIDPAEAEPAPMFLDWLEEARAELPQVSEDVNERVELAVELGYQALGASYVVARWRQVEQASDLRDLVDQQVQRVPRSRRNRAVVRRMVQPGEDLCRQTIGLMSRLRPHARSELRQSIDELVARCRELTEAFARLYS